MHYFVYFVDGGDSLAREASAVDWHMHCCQSIWLRRVLGKLAACVLCWLSHYYYFIFTLDRYIPEGVLQENSSIELIIAKILKISCFD